MEVVHRVLLVLVSVALITKEALATQYVVGGSEGWDASTDFNSWTSGQTFKVGDQLVFKYSSGLHSVVELDSEKAYKNCDLGSSVGSLSTGKDVVKLDKPGTRYFACGTVGHCDQGMKVKITTVAGNGPSSSSDSPTSESSAALHSHHSLPLAIAVFATFLLSVFAI